MKWKIWFGFQALGSSHEGSHTLKKIPKTFCDHQLKVASG